MFSVISIDSAYYPIDFDGSLNELKINETRFEFKLNDGYFTVANGIYSDQNFTYDFFTNKFDSLEQYSSKNNLVKSKVKDNNITTNLPYSTQFKHEKYIFYSMQLVALTHFDKETTKIAYYSVNYSFSLRLANKDFDVNRKDIHLEDDKDVTELKINFLKCHTD